MDINQMLLKNNNIKFRAIEPEDLDLLYRWENDTNLWIHGNTLAPYSRNTLRQYIEDAQAYDIFQSNQLRLVICLNDTNDTIVGAIDIYDVDAHARRAGIGVLVDEEYRDKGIATQAFELLHKYCFNFLHLHQLFAHISVNNTISLKLFEKVGYTQIGVLKDWIHTMDGYEDVILVQLIEDESDE